MLFVRGKTKKSDFVSSVARWSLVFDLIGQSNCHVIDCKSSIPGPFGDMARHQNGMCSTCSELSRILIIGYQ